MQLNLKLTTMKTTQFDARTCLLFTTEIIGPSYAQVISGEGYFIIINPNSRLVSFSKVRHDICFGDIVSDIIPGYTNQQYANDYGTKPTGMGKSVREYMQQNCKMNIK